MKKFLFAALFFPLLWAASARADIQVLTVASCGVQPFGVGLGNALTQDTTGKLCDGASGSSPTNPITVVIAPYAYTPLSPGQHNLSVASSTALTVPAGATYATVCVSTQAVNYTTDGTTTPTNGVGQPIAAGQCEAFSGPAVLANFRVIQKTATATLDVEYFR
jgi:hypothetical protein